MTASLIYLKRSYHATHEDLAGLQACLAQLVGESFRFARVSYGDEVTLHFGVLKPAKSPKLKNKLYGAYILGLRASVWILKSAPGSLIAAGLPGGPTESSKPLTPQEIESGEFIKPESRVLSAIPFVAKPLDGYGLEVQLSDASVLFVFPTPPEPGDSADDKLPVLSDWELLSPHGLVRAGPGMKWSFDPGSNSRSQPHNGGS